MCVRVLVRTCCVCGPAVPSYRSFPIAVGLTLRMGGMVCLVDKMLVRQTSCRLATVVDGIGSLMGWEEGGGREGRIAARR